MIELLGPVGFLVVWFLVGFVGSHWYYTVYLPWRRRR